MDKEKKESAQKIGMPEPTDGRRLYQVHGSGAIAEAFRQVQRRALREGRGPPRGSFGTSPTTDFEPIPLQALRSSLHQKLYFIVSLFHSAQPACISMKFISFHFISTNRP